MKNPLSKLMIHFVESRIEKNEKLKALAEQINQWRSYVDEKAKELSEKYSLFKLMSANNLSLKKAGLDTIAGNEVHGFLQTKYPDQYDDLIMADVLDKSIFYARQNPKPEIIKFVEDIDLTKYKVAKVEFSKEIVLDNYPNFPFTKAIFYAQENLEEAIYWRDCKMMVDGFEKNMRLGTPNLALIGFSEWNIPQILVTHSPFKNQAFYLAKIQAKDLKEEEKMLLVKIIHQMKKDMNEMESKVDEYQRDSLKFKELYSNLKDKIEANIPSDLERDLQQFQMEHKPTGFWNKYGNALLGVIVFVLLILLLIPR